jgi:hypothetical protein
MAKVVIPIQLDPQYKSNMDASAEYATLDLAETFAATVTLPSSTAYVGKKLLVKFESDGVTPLGAWYKIQPDGTLIAEGTGSGGGGGSSVLEETLTFTEKVGGISPGTSFPPRSPVMPSSVATKITAYFTFFGGD